MTRSPRTVSRNFEKVGEGLPVGWLLDELRDQDHLWEQYTFRQDFAGSPHGNTQSIYLRYLPLDTLSVDAVFNELEARPMEVVNEIPAAVDLVQIAADLIGVKKVGRVMLVKLHPGGVIDEHIDEGAYADFYERFHVCLSSEPGNVFHCGGETVHMRPGEMWWFNHKRLHSVENGSGEPRIHLIIDAVAPEYRVEREVA